MKKKEEKKIEINLFYMNECLALEKLDFIQNWQTGKHLQIVFTKEIVTSYGWQTFDVDNRVHFRTEEKL